MSGRHPKCADRQRYRDNVWVAGYNPLNEPTAEDADKLLDFYARIEKTIRAVDPHHILFLECGICSDHE